jgi:hypothetical protein
MPLEGILAYYGNSFLEGEEGEDGDKETRRQGDKETRRQGDKGTII